MNRRPFSLLSIALGALVLLAGGCSHNIPNTTVPDTRENRRVLNFVEEYRRAIEDRDVTKILSMVSERYLDSNGTPDPADDIDYSMLKKKLIAYEQVEDARVDMKYRSVRYDDSFAYVELRYRAMFRLPGKDGGKWSRAKPTQHRFVLERQRGSENYLFISGL